MVWPLAMFWKYYLSTLTNLLVSWALMIYNTTSYGGRLVLCVCVCVCMCMCVCLVRVCVFGKLRIFLCRTSHYFSRVKKYSSCTAHLLRATEGPGEKPNEAVCSAAAPHPLTHFQLSTVDKLPHCLYPNPIHTRKWQQIQMRLTLQLVDRLGWIWCAKAPNTHRWKLYPFCQTLQ